MTALNDKDSRTDVSSASEPRPEDSIYLDRAMIKKDKLPSQMASADPERPHVLRGWSARLHKDSGMDFGIQVEDNALR